MIRVLKGAQLAFQKDFPALFNGFIKICGCIAHIWLNHVAVTMQLTEQFLRIQQRFVVQMLKKHILLFTHPACLLPQKLLVKQLADLETDFCIFIRIKRGNA